MNRLTIIYKKIEEHFDIDQIKQTLLDNNLYESFLQISSEKELFLFCIENGFLDILIFLYENIKMKYNVKWITPYYENTKILGQEESDLSQTIKAGGVNHGLELEINDSSSSKRSPCLNYLVNTRKYSKMSYQTGEGIFYCYSK